MLKSKRFTKIVSLAVLVIFTSQQAGWAQDGAPIWPVSASRVGVYTYDKNLSDSGDVPVTIPYSAGKISLSHTGRNKEIIVNIQDAHASLSAQYAISGVLEHLVSEYDVDLIALEGAEGYINTSLLKTCPDKEARESTAKFLMREGRLSASEFFSITKERDVTLYGVENDALYRKNVENFRGVIEERAEYIAGVDNLLAGLSKLSDRVFSDDLKKLDEASRMHREGSMGFSQYWACMKELAAGANVAVTDHPNLKVLLRTVEAEKEIDFARADLERKRLIDVLSSNIERKDLEILVLKSLALKKDEISQSHFYSYLIDLAKAHDVPAGEYGDLIKFATYVSRYERIDILGLKKEIALLEESIRAKLFRTSDERKLAEEIKFIRALRKLYGVELKNSEYVFITENLEKHSAARLADLIREKSAKYGAEISSGYDLEEIFSGIKKALEFYSLAEERDRAMFLNTLKRMRKRGERIAALVTGGYHSKGMAELMRSNDLSYLVIIPKFKAGEERPYVAVLTNKKSSYEKVLETGKYHLAGEPYCKHITKEELIETAALNIGHQVARGRDYLEAAGSWLKEYTKTYEKDRQQSEDKVKDIPAPSEVAQILGLGDFFGKGKIFIERESKGEVSVVIDERSEEAGKPALKGFVLELGEDGVFQSPRIMSPRQLRSIGWYRKAVERIASCVEDTGTGSGTSDLLTNEEMVACTISAINTDNMLVWEMMGRLAEKESFDVDDLVRLLRTRSSIYIPNGWDREEKYKNLRFAIHDLMMKLRMRREMTFPASYFLERDDIDMSTYHTTIENLEITFRMMSKLAEDRFDDVIGELEGTEEEPRRALEVGGGYFHPVSDYINGTIFLNEKYRKESYYHTSGIKNVDTMSLDAIAADRPDEGIYKGNALKMDMFEDVSFDHVFCCNVFSEECFSIYKDMNRDFWEKHFPDQPLYAEAYFREIALELDRVTKPGGRIFIFPLSGDAYIKRMFELMGYEIELGGKMRPYVFRKPDHSSKTPSGDDKTAPASVPAIEKKVERVMKGDKYARWGAPWLEESIFFLFPVVAGHFVFGLDSIWTLLTVALTRAFFYYLHGESLPKNKSIMDLEKNEILAFMDPRYGELKKHAIADWKFAKAIAKEYGIEEESREMKMLKAICLAHDIGGVLGYKPDERTEADLLDLAKKHNIVYMHRDPQKVLEEFRKKGIKLTRKEKKFIRVMDHANNSIRQLEERGITMPDEVKFVISRHMDTPTEEEMARWSDVERRLFKIFTMADIFENGNSYYKRKTDYYKHLIGKEMTGFEKPDQTLKFLREIKFAGMPSMQSVIDITEEAAKSGGMEEAIGYSQMPHAPPKWIERHAIPFVTASYGIAVASLPIFLTSPAMMPVRYITLATLVMVATHFFGNIIALRNNAAPASLAGRKNIKGRGIKVFRGMVGTDLMDSAEKGELTVNRYMRRLDDEAGDISSVREGFRQLVEAGVFEIVGQNYTGYREMRGKLYRMTDEGRKRVIEIIEKNLLEWIDRMKKSDTAGRRRIARDITFGKLLGTAGSRTSPDPERMALLKAHAKEVFDVLFGEVKNEIELLERPSEEDGDEPSINAVNTALSVIEQIYERASTLGDDEILKDMVERMMMIPFPGSEDKKLLRALQYFFSSKVDARYGRTFAFYMLVFFMEYGNNILETEDKGIFELLRLVNEPYSRNFYYLLRRICSYYLRDHSGQVNVGPEHPLRARTRCQQYVYGPHMCGALRDSIHNNLSVHSLALVERILECWRTGDIKVLGDKEYQVDVLKGDEFPSYSKTEAFPQSTIDFHEKNGLDNSDMRNHRVVKRVFEYLEGEVGSSLGAVGENRWEKLRNIPDEGLQAIYDKINSEFDTHMNVEAKTHDFTGYIYAYRELSRRYQRMPSPEDIAEGLKRVYGNGGRAVIEDIFKEVNGEKKDGEKSFYASVISEDPMSNLKNILKVKQGVKEKIFTSTRKFDIEEEKQAFRDEWGRDDIGNAYGGSWIRNDKMALYRTDHILTILMNRYIEQMNTRFAEIDPANVHEALEYMSVLAGTGNTDGLFPRSFVDHIETLLVEKDLDVSTARDIIGFMQRECIEVQSYFIRNAENHIKALLDARNIFNEKERNEEFNKRLSAVLNHDRVYKTSSRLLARLASFLEDKEGVLLKPEDVPGRKVHTALFGGTVDKETLKASEDVGRYNLSAKGQDLVRMSLEGLAVPEGVIIPTTVKTGDIRKRSKRALKMLEKHVSGVEELDDMRFGSKDNPLIVSVRSGAYFVMPGQLPSISNVGLCRDTMEGFVKSLTSRGLDKNSARWTAWNSYARFLTTYAVSALGMDETVFEYETSDMLEKEGKKSERELSWKKMRTLAGTFEKIIIKEEGEDALPGTAEEQFASCVKTVKDSWQKSRKYCKNLGIRGEWPGTAVIVQRMIFGNISSDSGVGVINSRRANVREIGIEGDFLWGGQGDDIAQHRAEKTVSIDDIPDEMPWKQDLVKYASIVEASLGNMAEIEFTVQMGKVYILQVRNAYIDERAKDYLFVLPDRDLLAKRDEVLPASGGAYRGKVYVLHGKKIDHDDIDRMYRQALREGCDGLIAVSDDLEPEQMAELVIKDENGKLKVGGIVTRRGSRFSHAADIARYHRIAAVVKVDGIGFDEADNTSFYIRERRIRDGNILSISGVSGMIYEGLLPVDVREFLEPAPETKSRMSFQYFVSLLRTRGQILNAVQQLLNIVQDEVDVEKLTGYLNTILEVHREMLERTAPYVLASIEDVRSRKIARIEEVQKLHSMVRDAMQKEGAESSRTGFTDEMERTILKALSDEELLGKLWLTPDKIRHINIKRETTDRLRGRVSVLLELETEGRGTLDLRVVLYKSGYDLNPNLISDSRTIASRLLEYHRDGILPACRDRLENIGISPEMITSAAKAGTEEEAMLELADEIDKLDISYDKMAGVVARIGARNMEKNLRRLQALDDSIVYGGMGFMVLPQEDPYEAVKVRMRKSYSNIRANVQRVLVNEGFDDQRLSQDELHGIRKDSIKVLFRAYDNRADVYKTLAKAFGLKPLNPDMTFEDMRKELMTISAAELDENKKKLLSDILDITDGNGLAGDIGQAFDRLGSVQRFPIDIKLRDLIVRTTPEGRHKVEIISWGTYSCRTSEGEIIRYLHETLGFSYGAVFEALKEVYGRRDLVDFLRTAYLTEESGGAFRQNLQKMVGRAIDIPRIVVGIPQVLYKNLSENEINCVEALTGAEIAVLGSTSREGMLEELEGARKREGAVASALVDIDADRAAFRGTLEKMVREMQKEVLTFANVGYSGLTTEDIAKLEDLETLVKDIHDKYVDTIASLEVSTTSVYRMRIKKTYDMFAERKDSGCVRYTEQVTEDKEARYLVHYADGDRILSGEAGAIIPPGLEITRRREAMAVAKQNDPHRDIFMVMAPEGVVTDSEKASFKADLMELWMLEGVVGPGSIIILERRSVGYTASEIYDGMFVLRDGINEQNTGIRSINSLIEYDEGAVNRNILLVEMDTDADNNVNQYEILVNLLVRGDDEELLTIDGLKKEGSGRLYIYLPSVNAVDLEAEIEQYRRYISEVLIRA